MSEATDPHTPRARARAPWWTRLLDPVASLRAVPRGVLPRLVRLQREGESILGAAAAIALAIVLQYLLPRRVTDYQRWVFPVVALVLLLALGLPVLINNHGRLTQPSRRLRILMFLTVVVMAAANTAAAWRLVRDLVESEGIQAPGRLLFAGAAIWLTNVIVFALVYWIFDRGGPAARFLVKDTPPDLLFPQHVTTREHELWEPVFFDYFYTSFTAAAAFSPTDVLPLSRWAKLAMMVESSVSLVLAILVVARAVNILD